MPGKNLLSSAVALPGTISQILKNISIQKKFLQQHIAPIIQTCMKTNDSSIDEKDIKKINGYYGLAVPAILGEAFCTLRGSAMTNSERLASTAQGAMTGLFDDFFDKDYLSDEAVENMIHNLGENSHKRSNQALFDIFYKTALDHVPDKKSLVHALIDVYKAQVSSKLQVNPGIAHEALLQITMHKGGSSVLFYRTAFSPAIRDAERQLIFNLGAMMQLGNDIFDVYKDRESGISTLITKTRHIDAIRQLLRNSLETYYADAYRLGYPKRNTRAFLDIISIAVYSRCFVCLDQLEKNEQMSGGVFDVHAYSRKQLICDMDTTWNKLQSAIKHICVVP